MSNIIALFALLLSETTAVKFYVKYRTWCHVRKVNNCSGIEKKRIKSLAPNFVCRQCLTNSPPKPIIDNRTTYEQHTSVSNKKVPCDIPTEESLVIIESGQHPALISNESASFNSIGRALTAAERKRKRLKLKLTSLSIPDHLANKFLNDSSCDLSNVSTPQ